MGGISFRRGSGADIRCEVLGWVDAALESSGYERLAGCSMSVPSKRSLDFGDNRSQALEHRSKHEMEMLTHSIELIEYSNYIQKRQVSLRV